MAYSSLLTHHYSPEAATLPFVTSNTPGDAHTQKGNIYCFLLRTAFPASHSSIGSRHRKQDYSITQHHTVPLAPGPWPLGLRSRGLGAGQGKGAGNLYSSKNSPSALPPPRQGSDSATQEKCVFLGTLRPAFTSPATGVSLRWKDVVSLAEIQDARAHGTSDGRKKRLREAHHWTTPTTS